jgi:hypothetical protein
MQEAARPSDSPFPPGLRFDFRGYATGVGVRIGRDERDAFGGSIDCRGAIDRCIRKAEGHLTAGAVRVGAGAVASDPGRQADEKRSGEKNGNP